MNFDRLNPFLLECPGYPRNTALIMGCGFSDGIPGFVEVLD